MVGAIAMAECSMMVVKGSAQTNCVRNEARAERRFAATLLGAGNTRDESEYKVKKLAIGVVAAATMAMVAVPAAVAGPTGGYAVFAQCPIHEAGVTSCLYSPTESGHITIGKQEVPIVTTQILQGGLLREEEPFVKHLAGALNGETLTKTPQKVPGGLTGLVKCNEITGEGWFEKELRKACEAVFENKLTGVNAVTELAAPASSVVLNTAFEQLGVGTALTLPVKVRLENPLFGSECYIGSSSEPITLNLTTGATTGGPTGKPGTKKTKEEGGILEISGVSLVSNSFSAPKATGCGIFGLLDGLVDEKIGLPSAAGKNTAVLNGKVEIANSELVEESEG
jgi:hypothetical protein